MQEQPAPPPQDQQPQPEVPAVPLPPPENSQPNQERQPATSSGQPAEPQATQPTPSTPTPSTSKKKKKHHRKKTAKKAAQPGDAPTKTVVRNGSAPEPEVKFTPGTTTDQQNRQRGKVNYLLTSTDANLKKLSARELNETQQDAIHQIRSYMEQAKSALDEGDLQRGENLATKARLLSDDLLKH
jgi:hypothetical protein